MFKTCVETHWNGFEIENKINIKACYKLNSLFQSNFQLSIGYFGLTEWVILTLIRLEQGRYSLQFNGLRCYIKHLEECFIKYPNNLKSVKNLGCASFFQPTSRCLDILMKHPFSGLIYYLTVMSLISAGRDSNRAETLHVNSLPNLTELLQCWTIKEQVKECPC